MSTLPKNNPKLINAWCMYDWANSVFSLTITTAIFPEYFLGITSKNVHMFGLEFENEVLFSYTVSAAFLITALLSPFLTAIADYSGRKKIFMQTFCFIGAFACSTLFFFSGKDISEGGMLFFGLAAFLIGLVGYSGSIVFYNSYLPEIATEDQFDRVSARGFSFGYIGSVLLLIVNLVMIIFHESLGFESGGAAARISFLTVGVWWVSFALYTFYYLPRNVYEREPQGGWIFNGLRELKKVFNEVRKLRLLKRFLIAFFFYNMGVQAVMYLAPLFAKKEIFPDPKDSSQLIVTILIIQLVAIIGAMFFNFVSSKWGNTRALLLGVVVWIGICIMGYFVQKGLSFYILAATIGFVMGGIQSLSRATFSKLIPEETKDHASYFSFYDVADKLSIVAGTFVYGYVNDITGSQRNSVVALGIIFVFGLIFLLFIPSKKIYHTHVEE